MPASYFFYARLTTMAKPRGREHTSLTETAKEVVRVLERIPGVKMIAPGEINVGARGRGGNRYVTIVYTTAGFELIITGQSVQKVAVHTEQSELVTALLREHKKLQSFTFKERERKPEI